MYNCLPIKFKHSLIDNHLLSNQAIIRAICDARIRQGKEPQCSHPAAAAAPPEPGLPQHRRHQAQPSNQPQPSQRARCGPPQAEARQPPPPPSAQGPRGFPALRGPGPSGHRPGRRPTDQDQEDLRQPQQERLRQPRRPPGAAAAGGAGGEAGEPAPGPAGPGDGRGDGGPQVRGAAPGTVHPQADPHLGASEAAQR